MRLACGFAVLVLIFSAALARAETLLVLGDSLSAAYNIPIQDGWVSLLERRLAADGCQVEVVNASISGETSLGGLNRLPKLLADHQPSIVMVALGGNDGLRGFPAATVERNLREIVTRSRTAGARVLLAGIRVPTNYGPRYGEEFAAVFERIASELGVPLVPFLLEGVALEPGMVQGDGVHPTAAAQPRILENVLPQVVAELNGCKPCAASTSRTETDNWILEQDPLLSAIREHPEFRTMAAEVRADIETIRARVEQAETTRRWDELLSEADQGITEQGD